MCDDFPFKNRYKNVSDDEEPCSEKLPFLQRLRGTRSSHLSDMSHHKTVPGPSKRCRKKEKRGRYIDQDEDEDIDEVTEAIDPPTEAPKGVPDPYYPIFLPIDQAFKSKYAFHHKKGKTCQERTYVFLEHPGGWLCFIYHFSV